MSSISSVHSISVYDSKEPAKAETGNTLIVSRGNAKSNTVSVCASLPTLTQEDVLNSFETLVPHILDMLNLERGKLVRKFAEKGEIRSEQCDIAAIVIELEGEARLSKEAIAEYLKAPAQSEALKAAFALKFKWGDALSEEQVKKLDQLSNALRDKLSELAGNKTSWSEKEQNVALSYLEILEESSMKDRLLGRLVKMGEKKQDNTLEALGF